MGHVGKSGSQTYINMDCFSSHNCDSHFGENESGK